MKLKLLKNWLEVVHLLAQWHPSLESSSEEDEIDGATIEILLLLGLPSCLLNLRLNADSKWKCNPFNY